MSTNASDCCTTVGLILTQYLTSVSRYNLFLNFLNTKATLSRLTGTLDVEETKDGLICKAKIRNYKYTEPIKIDNCNECFTKELLETTIPTCHSSTFTGFGFYKAEELNRAICVNGGDRTSMLSVVMNIAKHFVNSLSVNISEWVMDLLYADVETQSNGKTTTVPFYQYQKAGIFDYGASAKLSMAMMYEIGLDFGNFFAYNPDILGKNGPKILLVDKVGLMDLRADWEQKYKYYYDPSTTPKTNDGWTSFTQMGLTIPPGSLYIPEANLYVITRDSAMFKVTSDNRPIYPLFLANDINILVQAPPRGNNLNGAGVSQSAVSVMDTAIGSVLIAMADNIIQKRLAGEIYLETYILPMIASEFSAGYLLGTTRTGTATTTKNSGIIPASALTSFTVANDEPVNENTPTVTVNLDAKTDKIKTA